MCLNTAKLLLIKSLLVFIESYMYLLAAYLHIIIRTDSQHNKKALNSMDHQIVSVDVNNKK